MEEENIFGLKGLTRKDWEDWLNDYKDQLEGLSEEEKKDYFIDGHFYSKFKDDKRIADLENVSIEEKKNLYNYHHDYIEGIQEGWKGNKELPRWVPDWLYDTFTPKSPMEYSSEELLQKANTSAENSKKNKERNKNMSNIDLMYYKYYNKKYEDIKKEKDPIRLNNLLENLVEDRFGYDTYNNYLVKLEELNIASFDNIEDKRKAFEKSVKNIEKANALRDEIGKAVMADQDGPYSKENLTKMFDLIFSENDKYKLFKGGEDNTYLKFDENKKVRAMINVLSLINTDYESLANKLVDDIVTAEIADNMGTWENISRGFLGLGAKFKSIPMFLKGLVHGLFVNESGHGIINDLVDDPYMRWAMDISDYGYIDKEKLEEQKNKAISDILIVRRPEDENQVNLSSGFLGEVINLHGFSLMTMALSSGASTAVNLLGKGIKAGHAAYRLSHASDYMKALRNIVNFRLKFDKGLKIFGVGSSLFLSTSYEGTQATILDKILSIKEGTDKIKNYYIANKIKDLSIPENFELFAANNGFKHVLQVDDESGKSIDGYVDNEGNLYPKESLLRAATDLISDRFDTMMKLDELDKPMPEELQNIKNDVAPDFKELEEDAAILANVGFITRSLSYGLLAGTLKATLLAGSVLQALRGMGLGKPKFRIIDGKVESTSFISRLVANKYGYAAVTSLKESLGEAAEEWIDEVDGAAALGVGDYYLNNYLNLKYNGLGQEEMINTLAGAISLGVSEALKATVSKEAIDAGIMGGVCSMIGGLSFNRGFSISRRQKGESKVHYAKRILPITWRSGLTGSFIEGKYKYEDEEKTIQEIQEWYNDPENRKIWESAASITNWVAKMQLDINASDEYMYRNDNLAKTIHSVMMLQQLLGSDFANQALKAINIYANIDKASDELKKLAIEEYKNEYQNREAEEDTSDEEILQRIKKNGSTMLEYYNRIKKESKKIDNSLEGFIEPDVKESMIYGNILQDELKERLEKMEKELNELKINNSVESTPMDSKLKRVYSILGNKGYAKKLDAIKKALKTAEEEYKKANEDLKNSVNKPTYYVAAIRYAQAKLVLRTLKERQKAVLKGGKVLNKNTTENGEAEKYILSEQDIMNLSPSDRLYIMDKKNRENYSEEQKKVIENLEKQLQERSAERQDGRLYSNMINDVNKAIIDLLKYLEHYYKILKSPKTSNLYANRLKEYIHDKSLLAMANKFVDSNAGTSYQEFSERYNNTVLTLSPKDRRTFDNYLNAKNDPNVRNKIKNKRRIKDVISFLKAEKYKLPGTEEELNTNIMEELLNTFDNNGESLDDLDINNHSIEELNAKKRGIKDNQLLLNIESNLSSIMSDYYNHVSKKSSTSEGSTPNTNPTSNPLAQQEEEFLKEMNGGQAEEGNQYLLTSNEGIIELFSGSASSVRYAIRMMLNKADKNDLFKDGNKSKEFKAFVLNLARNSKIYSNVNKLFELAESDLKNLKNEQKLLFNTIISDVKNSDFTDANLKEQSLAQLYKSSFGDSANLNLQGMIPMDIALLHKEGVFTEELLIMFDPYFLLWELMRCGKFLLLIYESGNMTNNSTFSQKIYFITNVKIQNKLGEDIDLVSALKQSFEKAGLKFTNDDIPIIAIVESNNGPIKIGEKYYLPISIFPSTGSNTGGSKGLKKFRDLAALQDYDKLNDEGLPKLLRDGTEPVLPLKLAPLFGNINALRGDDSFDKNEDNSVNNILINDLSEEKKEKLKNGTEEEKKNIWKDIKDFFLNNLTIGILKTTKGDYKVLLLKIGGGNLKNESSIADIEIRYLFDTVNSEGKKLEEVEDLTLFNGRTRGFTSLFYTLKGEPGNVINAINNFLEENENKTPVIIKEGKAVFNYRILGDSVNKMEANITRYLNRYLNLPTSWNYKLLPQIGQSGEFENSFTLQVTNGEETIELGEIDVTSNSVNVNKILHNLIFDENNEYRLRPASNGERVPFCLWLVDYEIMTLSKPLSVNENLPLQVLMGIREGIFEDGILYSHRDTFKYTPTGVKLNNPYGGMSKLEANNKPKVDTNTLEGNKEPEGTKESKNPLLVLKIINKLKQLRLNCITFKLTKASKLVNPIGVTSLARSSNSIYNILVTDELAIRDDIEIGNGISYKGNKIYLKKSNGQGYIGIVLEDEINIDSILGLTNSDAVKLQVYDIITSINIPKYIGTNYDNTMELSSEQVETIKIIGANLSLRLSDFKFKLMQENNSGNSILKMAAPLGNTFDSIVRDVFDADSNIEGMLDNTEELYKKYPNVSRAVIKDIVQQIKTFKKNAEGSGITFYSKEILLENNFKLIDLNDKCSLNVRGIPDLIGYDAFGNIYVYDIKTHHKNSIILGNKKKRYEMLLKLYAELIAKEFGVKPQSVKLGILPIALDYDTHANISVSQLDKNILLVKLKVNTGGMNYIDSLVPYRMTEHALLEKVITVDYGDGINWKTSSIGDAASLKIQYLEDPDVDIVVTGIDESTEEENKEESDNNNKEGKIVAANNNLDNLNLGVLMPSNALDTTNDLNLFSNVNEEYKELGGEERSLSNSTPPILPGKDLYDWNNLSEDQKNLIISLSIDENSWKELPDSVKKQLIDCTK